MASERGVRTVFALRWLVDSNGNHRVSDLN